MPNSASTESREILRYVRFNPPEIIDLDGQSVDKVLLTPQPNREVNTNPQPLMNAP